MIIGNIKSIQKLKAAWLLSRFSNRKSRLNITVEEMNRWN